MDIKKFICSIIGEECTKYPDICESCSFYLNHTKSKDNTVQHPSHYTTGKIETIDFIMDKNLNFQRGSVVKYVVRAGLKDKSKEIEDLEKAKQYIEFEIKRLKAVHE